MRALILSDIHANLDALNAVLAAAPAHDEVWNLGDVVGYGANPNEVIERVRDRCQVFVRGNHDKACSGVDSIDGFNPIAGRAAHWTRCILTPEHTDWLRAMPAGPVLPDGPDMSCSCVHGSLLDEDEYVLTVRDAWAPLTRARTRINFFGHTHLQGGFATNGEEWFRITPQYHARGADEFELPLRNSGRYLINPGSVGQPRDGDWRAAFALYETEGSGEDAIRQVIFYRVPYDVKCAQKKILAAGLPNRLASRLKEGR
ncbi:MAG TPA: metallophosphoesterase family protein [Acidobacteriaceae bacterium]|nr:metallophosphoesterase family protein [Acidobacteriaceae bacterium]